MQNLAQTFPALLLVALLLSSSTGAAGERVPILPTPDFGPFDIATYSFAATARDEVPAVVRVRLDSRELLHVALELWRTNYGAVPDKTFRRVLRLSSAAFDDLLADVQVLSVAEVRSLRSLVICRVIPSAQMKAGVLAVRRDYDPQQGAFLGKPAILQSAPGCWNLIQINLTQPEDRERAGKFRAKLEILAAQVLRRQLVEVLR